MSVTLPRGCPDCQVDDEGRIVALCPEGRQLHDVDTATPAGVNPEAYRQFAVHVWGVGQPPDAALGAPIPDAKPYAQHDDPAYEVGAEHPPAEEVS